MTVTMEPLVAAAHAALEAKVARINALNVYPVPDGDTGTNMLLTLESILKEASGQDVRRARGGHEGGRAGRAHGGEG